MDLVEVRFTFGEGDDDRTLTFTAVGTAWVERLDDLAGAVGAVAPC